jgi:hypothetical protein
VESTRNTLEGRFKTITLVAQYPIPSRRRSIDQSGKGKRKESFGIRNNGKEAHPQVGQGIIGTRRSTNSWISEKHVESPCSLLFEVKPVIWFWRRMSMDKGSWFHIGNKPGLGHAVVMQESKKDSKIVQPPSLNVECE